jgi:Tol biopolymer transport system component
MPKIDTVGTTWQISKGLDFANHQYTDIPVYNSNGSMVLFKDGNGNFYINKSLTSLPQKLIFKDEPTGKVEWDRNRPEILYYLSTDKSYSYVRRLNLDTSTDELIYKTESEISEIAPPHPDGDHLLLAPKDQEKSTIEVYSLSTGKSIKIPINIPLHRVRFTQAPDLTIYVNRSAEPKTSWLVDVPSGQKRQVYQGASTSPNWRPGGENFCFYGNYNGKRSLLVLDTTGTVVKFFPELKNHHLCWSRDGKYIVTDVEQKIKEPYGGWICVVNFETGEIKKVVKHESDFDDEDGNKNSSGHPHPQLSPDATKVVYNSSKLGIEHPQVFVSVTRLPDTVENAKLTRSEGNFILKWSESKGREIQQYLVYCQLTDGETELAATLHRSVTNFSEKIREGIREYWIVAQEYSSLQSEPAVLSTISH